MRVANQFEQMMILDVLDFVREADEAAVNIIQRATVKLVAQLFAANGQSMTAGVFAQHLSLIHI